MNDFGKICVVFVTAASLAFVAFAGAMRTGGRNWLAEADEISDQYTLSITPGDTYSYAITERRTAKQIGTSKVLAEVVTKARADQASTVRNQLNDLNQRREALEPQTAAAAAAIVADEAGLKQREAALVQQVEDVHQEIARISEDILAAVNEVQRIRSLGQERREEGYRLKNQLELLRNDLHAATVQRKNLQEEELRLKETLQRLERRNRQLAEATGSPS